MEGIGLSVPALLFGLAGLAVAAYILYLPILLSRGTQKASTVTMLTIAGLIIWPLWLVAFVMACMATGKPANDASASDDQPGTFAVVGVDRESTFDTRLIVEADSAENARVKGELRGMVVTSVERIG